MGKFGFVTDSTAYIPSALIEKYNVKLAPIQVIFADRTYKEGVDLTPEEFYTKLVGRWWASPSPLLSTPPTWRRTPLG